MLKRAVGHFPYHPYAIRLSVRHVRDVHCDDILAQCPAWVSTRLVLNSCEPHHFLRYADLDNGTNFKSTMLNIGVFYPLSLVLTLVSIALSPLALLLKVFGCHPMDRKHTAQVGETDGDVLQILVRTEGGAMITLDVDREASVQSLLPKVKDNLGLAFDKRVIHLMYEDAMLDESPNSNIQGYGLDNGDVLQLIVEPDEIEITVRLENGELVTVKMQADSSVDQLKATLERQTGYARNIQWLLLDGEELDGSRSLRSLSSTELELFEVTMTLEVTVSNGDTHQVIIRRDARFAELAESIAGLVQVDVADIEILFNDQPFDEEMTLHAQGLRNGSTVVVNVPEEESDEEYGDVLEEELGGGQFLAETQKLQRSAVSEAPRRLREAEELEREKDKAAPKKKKAAARRKADEKKKRAKEEEARPPPPPQPIIEEKEEDGLVLESSLETGLEVYDAEDQVEKEELVFGKGDIEGGEVLLEDERKAKKEKRKERARERRRRIRGYIKDILRNVSKASSFNLEFTRCSLQLCMFDPNGKVIMFAAATVFLSFTFAANYGYV